MTDSDEARRLHGDYTKELYERERGNSASLDRAILALSTGSLGVSVAFISNLVKLSEAKSIIMLQGAWCLFGAAIVSTILSFLVSHYGLKTQFRYAEKYYLEGIIEYCNKRSSWDRATNILNLLSATVFIAGLILFIIFILTNI